MENKSDANKNKTILRAFNCTMNKMYGDGENRTQIL